MGNFFQETICGGLVHMAGLPITHTVMRTIPASIENLQKFLIWQVRRQEESAPRTETLGNSPRGQRSPKEFLNTVAQIAAQFQLIHLNSHGLMIKGFVRQNQIQPLVCSEKDDNHA